jgi:phosphate transport system substrate-binding protein
LIVKKKSLLVVLVLAVALVFSQLAMVQGTQAANISVEVNGQPLSLDVPPAMDNNRVLVPMRAIFEAIGAKVDWDNTASTVSAVKDGKKIYLTIGQKLASVSGEIVALDVPAKLVNGRTLVPIRFVSESLGARVDWDNGAQKVIISTGAVAALEGSLKLSGSTSVQPLAEELAQAFMKKHPKVNITIAGGGSGVGIKDVADGKVNIGNASRGKKDSDPTGLFWHAIARDAVVVVVHPNNPVKELTKNQVNGIYTGKITNWKDVGGKDAPIIVNSRTVPSGTYDFFVEEFLKKEEKIVATAKQHASNGLVRQAVAANENAIGFISMGYLNDTVKAPKLDGVVPSMENAKNGTYHLVRPFNMITKGEPTGLAKAFLDFALSAEGQSIVAKDYIPVK